MPRYTVEVWETRSYVVPVEADNEDDAKEVALEDYAEASIEDSFVSIEFRSIETVNQQVEEKP